MTSGLATDRVSRRFVLFRLLLFHILKASLQMLLKLLVLLTVGRGPHVPHAQPELGDSPQAESVSPFLLPSPVRAQSFAR